MCLIDNFNEHRCYLFYNISKDKEYLSIHNILTPKKYRKMGYAYTLLAHMFSELSNEEIQRFKLWCVSSSVSFYNKLGLHYWGVNELGQYYCDFAMPKLSIKEIPSIIKDTKLKEFSTVKLNQIYEKIQQNGSEFSDKERRIYDNCVQKMKYRYRFESFVQEVRDRKLVKR